MFEVLELIEPKLEVILLAALVVVQCLTNAHVISLLVARKEKSS